MLFLQTPKYLHLSHTEPFSPLASSFITFESVCFLFFPLCFLFFKRHQNNTRNTKARMVNSGGRDREAVGSE